MKQLTLKLLTNFEHITALYFSEGKEPTRKHIELAIKKCAQWNKQRIGKGLKPWELEMIKVGSFSGGRTSARMCSRMLQKFGRKRTAFVYMDTGLEHPKTYDFIREVNSFMDLNITCIQADFSKPLNSPTAYKVVDIDNLTTDFSIFKAMLAKYGVPYIGGMFCTSRLKTRPFKAYCKDIYGLNNYETWLGIREDEPARLIGDKNYKLARKVIGCTPEMALDMYHDFRKRGVEALGGHFVLGEDKEKELFDKIHRHLSDQVNENKFHLADITDDHKQDINKFWSEQYFDLQIPEWLGNCILCPKKSNLKLAAAKLDEESFYGTYVGMIKSHHVRMDEKTGHWSKMYRGKQSLESLIATFDGQSGDEIKQRIISSRYIDSGSCSESCEL